jgi:hypothetical protein
MNSPAIPFLRLTLACTIGFHSAAQDILQPPAPAQQASNLRLPIERRVHVLLIDPPVDWSKINSKEDLLGKDFGRESHMAEVLEREVYAKGRKALFFAGGTHLGRGGAPEPNQNSPSRRFFPDESPSGDQIQWLPFSGTAPGKADSLPR